MLHPHPEPGSRLTEPSVRAALRIVALHIHLPPRFGLWLTLEAQLGALLEDFLTPEQHEANVRVLPESSEQVEFAIKLPGQGSGQVWLPIDSKFPQEDYERLLNAQRAGDPGEVQRSDAALERAIRLQAKTIEEKYVREPHSTGFAIMFLPTRRSVRGSRAPAWVMYRRSTYLSRNDRRPHDPAGFADQPTGRLQDARDIAARQRCPGFAQRRQGRVRRIFEVVAKAGQATAYYPQYGR